MSPTREERAELAFNSARSFGPDEPVDQGKERAKIHVVTALFFKLISRQHNHLRTKAWVQSNAFEIQRSCQIQQKPHNSLTNSKRDCFSYFNMGVLAIPDFIISNETLKTICNDPNNSCKKKTTFTLEIQTIPLS